MILVSLVFIVVQVALDLKMPDYMSEITRYVQTEGSAMSDVLTNGRQDAVMCFGKHGFLSHCRLLCCQSCIRLIDAAERCSIQQGPLFLHGRDWTFLDRKFNYPFHQ